VPDTTTVVFEDKLPLSVTVSRFEKPIEPTVVVKLFPMVTLSLAPVPLIDTEPADIVPLD
jgi:hypothetical protein